MNLSSLFTFNLPTRIVHGPGAALHIASELARLRASSVLLMTDSGVCGAGLVGDIEEAAREVATTVELFDSIEANPRQRTVEQAAAVGRDSGTDVIVAVGGGSVLDAAKAAGILLAAGGSLRDYEGRDRVPVPITPLIAVPTTAGTGSEVTFSAVITDPARRRKFSINSKLAAAVVAICDPELTVTLPPEITAATGMDALTHAVEAFTVTCTNPVSEALAVGAIELIGANLIRAVSDGEDLAARSAMLLGSMMAGIAFANADVGAVHCMAEALGGLYDTPHGVANAMFLAPVMAYNLPVVEDRLARVARGLGVNTVGMSEAEAAGSAVDAVQLLAAAVGIPRFSELGSVDLEELATAAAGNGSVPSNPRPIGREDFLELFRAAQD